MLVTVADKAPQWFEARTSLGVLLHKLARYAEAEPHERAAVRFADTAEKEAIALNNLAQLLQDTNRLDEAEPLMRRALEIDETSYGSEHPRVATQLNNLAVLLQATNRLDEAEPPMRRGLGIFVLFQLRTKHAHPHEETVLGNYRSLLTAIGHDQNEAEALITSLIESVKLENRALDLKVKSTASHFQHIAAISCVDGKAIREWCFGAVPAVEDFLSVNQGIPESSHNAMPE